ncbi:MAG: hypothetical protein J5845_09485 [Lachnospiraceae bacterium]|nr:hypothetical protein [Lachnospiraceae bacterium]MBO4651948.1 hypothetical protein [Lachnospiraceae bacterium]
MLDRLFDSGLLYSYLNIIAHNLLLVWLIEIPLAFALGVRKRNPLETVFITNSISNPIVVTIFFLMLQFSVSYAIMNFTIIAMEVCVVLCEGAVYRRYLPKGKLNPFVLSLVLNAASFCVGILPDLL